VKNLSIPLFAGILCSSFTIVPSPVQQDLAGKTTGSSLIRLAVKESSNPEAALYHQLNLEEYGLSAEAFNYAWKGYQHLLAKNSINCRYLTICDFSQASSRKRMYILDLNNNDLIINTYVAHGRNSGGVYASRFSNKPESLQSSLGFYITGNTYYGQHGLSLRIHGMEKGVNDNAWQRTIVIHGATYVDASRAIPGGFMGRSYGCPAVPQHESTKIINTIKNGTCLFIYHPSGDYLLNSKILND
jgi:hypothetical protein